MVENNDKMLSASELNSASDIDPWLASSLMQKAIRRGEVELALRAAHMLHAMRGSRVFHRLAVVACEDIGIAAPDVVVETVAACGDAVLRGHAGGDSLVLGHLVERLAESPKDRSADLLASVVHHCPQLASVRADMAARTMADRIAVAADPTCDFYERAVAAWYASGVEWGRERRVGRGDLLGLLRGMRDAGVPERWCVTVKRAVKLGREPLFVMMLLLGDEISVSRDVRTVTLPTASTEGGVPTYVFDKHTRLGLQALRRFGRENQAVAAALSKHVAEFRRMAALNIAAFYADGAAVDRRRDWHRSDEIEKRGISSDIMYAGVPEKGIAPLREVIASNLGHLNAIRVELVQRTRRELNCAGGSNLG